MWFHFGIFTVQKKNWLYKLAYKNQLLDDSRIDVILYYIRKRAKYSNNNDCLKICAAKDHLVHLQPLRILSRWTIWFCFTKLIGDTLTAPFHRQLDLFLLGLAHRNKRRSPGPSMTCQLGSAIFRPSFLRSFQPPCSFLPNCNFNNLIHNIWDVYYNFESNINKDSMKESILEYINGYRMHVAASWHTVGNILIPVNVKEIFHWILIVVSFNDRCIQIYDSLSGGALHDSKVENEIKKYAQLIPMYLSKSSFYGKKDIDISSHPKYKSHSEFDSFEMIYVKDIPQQTEGSFDCGLYVVAYADHISNGNGVPNSFDSEFTRIQYAALLWSY
ncbi:hypothetical protein H5410_036807 [Solanum commersonii]|uniref:Ubiquitin-like protease family profile domain-containing protein n=1 Tax=Solanum commersonii TaxID=4109 RepID=A0A9J5Y6P9_SOLCO|nr:hypothetical protein H5410_036807 [Solanum commersonii]